MPSVISMGPFIEYNDFISNTKDDLPASPFLPGLKVLVEALIYLGIFQVNGSYLEYLLILKRLEICMFQRAD